MDKNPAYTVAQVLHFEDVRQQYIDSLGFEGYGQYISSIRYRPLYRGIMATIPGILSKAGISGQKSKIVVGPDAFDSLTESDFHSALFDHEATHAMENYRYPSSSIAYTFCNIERDTRKRLSVYVRVNAGSERRALGKQLRKHERGECVLSDDFYQEVLLRNYNLFHAAYRLALSAKSDKEFELLEQVHELTRYYLYISKISFETAKDIIELLDDWFKSNEHTRFPLEQ